MLNFYVSIAFKVLNIIKIDASISATVKKQRHEGKGEEVSFRQHTSLTPCVLWFFSECCAVSDYMQFIVQ